MKKTVLVTGANGFIAGHLIPILQQKYEVKLLTRHPQSDNEYAWDLSKNYIDEKALDNVTIIVHLSGSKLNDGTPLTEERKKLVYDTRIGAADFLREKLKERNQKLESFVSASAIGYYGFTDSTLEIDETGNKGFDFNANMCDDWEKAGQRLKTEGVAAHAAQIRVSLVLGRDGGILPMYQNILAQNPQAAARSDQSAMPWNHVEDMAGMFAYAVDKQLDGIYNSVAPTAASSGDVLKAIANQTNGAGYTISPFTGQRLVSHKIINAGYEFKFPDIESAVNNLLSGK